MAFFNRLGAAGRSAGIEMLFWLAATPFCFLALTITEGTTASPILSQGSNWPSPFGIVNDPLNQLINVPQGIINGQIPNGFIIPQQGYISSRPRKGGASYNSKGGPNLLKSNSKTGPSKGGEFSFPREDLQQRTDWGDVAIQNSFPTKLSGVNVNSQETSYLDKILGILGVSGTTPQFDVQVRLQKIDYYFERLGVLSEDCRQRLLCEVAKSPEKYFPLSDILYEETSIITNNGRFPTAPLINTSEGARLLSYMEATFRGQDRSRKCDVFEFRCPSSTEDLINYENLLLWKVMLRWITINIVSRKN